MISMNRILTTLSLLAACVSVVGYAEAYLGATVDREDLSGIERDARQTTRELVLNCDETISITAVDPSIAQEYLPHQYTLYTESGLGQVIVIVQDCSKAVLDGVDYAPLKINHFWIRRTGPFEIAPIPGATQTVPTFYWYQHHMLTTSWRFFKQAWKAGFRINLARQIDLGPLGGTSRTVEVVEHGWHGKKIGYGWIHQIHPFPPVPIGINHRVEGMQYWRPWLKDSKFSGKKLELHARGLIFQSSSDNPVEVTAHPKSILGKFGGLLYGMGKDFQMDFKATITTTGRAWPER